MYLSRGGGTDKMADPLTSGAIFRIKNAAALRSPMPRLPGTPAPATPAADPTPVGNAGTTPVEVVRPTAVRTTDVWPRTPAAPAPSTPVRARDAP